MKNIYLTLVFLSQISVAQQVVFYDAKDTTQKFYQQYLPENPPKGLIVVFYGQFTNPKLATDKGLALVSLTPQADYLQTMFGTDILKISDEMIVAICKKNQIPLDKVIVGGLSAAGTLAIRFAENSNKARKPLAKQNGKIINLKPVAVFAADPPLDYERFWYECSRKVKINFHPAATEEGKTVLQYMKNNLGGSPEKYLQKYWLSAPYSHHAPNGGQIGYLKNTPIRIYHEPDVNWWIENRRQDYYAMNSIDCAGAINDLQILGNTQAELIGTSNKGYRDNGLRHPHSWSIIDEPALVAWCLKIVEK